MSRSDLPLLIEQVEERVSPDQPYVYCIELPSRGYLYGGSLPGGKVYLTPLTGADEALFASQKVDRTSLVDIVCKRRLVNLPIRYEELLLGDMVYILLCLRHISYGTEYKFLVTCPNCNTRFQSQIDIPQGLKSVVLTAEDDCEPYNVKLPLSGDEIQFRLLRVQDEEEIRRYARNRLQKVQELGDPGYCYRLSCNIVSINGEIVDAIRKLAYVEGLVGRDIAALKNAIDEREFGPSLMIDLTCGACGFKSRQMMPFDREFFRPGSTRDFST